MITILAVAVLATTQPGFWETRPTLAIARQEVGAAVLGSSIYVAGGLGISRGSLASVERLDPGAPAWQRVADMPTTRHHFGMAEAGGKLWVVGGYVSSFTPDDQVFEYDPATNVWLPRANLPRPRGALGAATIGGKVYAVGGVAGGTTVGDLDVYDPATDRWQPLAPMPTPREHVALAVIAGKLYVAGGRAGGGNVRTLEVYDPATDRWTPLRNMPTARSGNGAAGLDGRLIVVGGEGARMFGENEEYDPATNTWRRLADMSLPVHGIYPVTIGDELVVAGGGTVVGFGATAETRAFRRLPDGTVRYGVSTAACAGALVIAVSSKPIAPNPSFAFAIAAGAPPNGLGALMVGLGEDRAGTPVFDITVFVDLRRPVVLLPATADAGGAASVGLPIPGHATGARFAAQLVWANTPSCGAPRFLSASDALSVLVR